MLTRPRPLFAGRPQHPRVQERAPAHPYCELPYGYSDGDGDGGRHGHCECHTAAIMPRDCTTAAAPSSSFNTLPAFTPVNLTYKSLNTHKMAPPVWCASHLAALSP